MKQPEALRIARELDDFNASIDRRAAAELRRLHTVNQELLKALRAGHSTFHTLPGGEACQCSQCQFVRLRNAAIAEATGETS